MSEKNCLIFFTKSPELGKCKTRLNDFLSLEEALNLQKYLIAKNYAIAKKFNSIVFYDGELKKLQEIINKVCFFAQKGSNIGEKMAHAFEKAFELGYEKVVLIGSDLDNLSSKIIKKAYKKLDKFDAVFAPSDDGGYSLIGLNRAILSQIYTIFNIKFSHKFVFRDSLKLLKNNKFTILKPIKDIDTKFDIFAKFIKTNKIKFLASGEYNSNYLFKKGGKKWLLRINHASQMGLKDQISYEYNALKILQKSGVTPKVYKIFSKSEYLPNGALVMEYLKGRSLVYETDLKIASYLLSKVHQTKIPKNHHLITAKKPFLAMFKECEDMAKVYQNSPNPKKELLEFFAFAFNKLRASGLNADISNPAIINTELNSSNFIIFKDKFNSYIIDWEKPIIGDLEQDLGHFLAPTTTLFKTDTILSKAKIYEFLNSYENHFYEKLLIKYIAFNCLRGISWCAMASVNHQNKNATLNPKIKLYLESKFLNIVKEYINMEKL